MSYFRVVTGEIFPLKARAKCLSMTTATNWLLNWAIAYATPYMVNPNPGTANPGINLGAKVFFLWGGFCLVCAFFVWGLIYESKGLSLEQVDEMYAKESKAWKSTSFVPSVSFQEVRDVAQNARRESLADIEAAAARKRSVAHVDRNGGSEELHEKV